MPEVLFLCLTRMITFYLFVNLYNNLYGPKVHNNVETKLMPIKKYFINASASSYRDWFLPE